MSGRRPARAAVVVARGKGGGGGEKARRCERWKERGRGRREGERE